MKIKSKSIVRRAKTYRMIRYYSYGYNIGEDGEKVVAKTFFNTYIPCELLYIDKGIFKVQLLSQQGFSKKILCEKYLNSLE